MCPRILHFIDLTICVSYQCPCQYLSYIGFNNLFSYSYWDDNI